MRRWHRGAISLALVALLLSGCALFRPSGPTPPDFTAGPEALSEWLRGHVGGAASVKALITVSLRAPRGSVSFDGLLFSARPSNLRLQGFSPLGQRFFDLAAEGGMVELRLENPPRYVEGTIDSLGGRLELPALPQLLELMATMTIVPPDPSHHVELESAVRGFRATPVLAFFLGSGEDRVVTRRIWLDRTGLPWQEAWYDAQGRRTALVHYNHYELMDARWQPRKIEAELAGDVAVKVRVKSLQQNPAWRPDDFQIQRSADAAARG
jgi:hypothetical protein